LPKWLLPVWESGGYLLNVLCERMAAAGVREIVIGVHPDNQALMAKYAPKGCHVVTVESANMSQTVLAMQRWCGGEQVVLGMPDTFWEAPDVFGGVECRQSNVLAFCWTARPDQDGKLGMVQIEKDTEIGINRVLKIIDKTPGTGLKQAWGAMMWTPEFWQYISPEDSHLGYSLQRAMAAGEVVQAVQVRGEYYDCGTIEEYARLMTAYAPRLWVENGRKRGG
jgi:UTP-glucose-1-phosphate uridylyltransferase